MQMTILGTILVLIFSWMAYSFFTTDWGEMPKIDQVMSSDNIKGNIQAKKILTEYSDFQCPACEFRAGIIRDAWDEIKDEVVFIYRHFPLVQIHGNAKRAAEYSEAAAMQGKFWEMHDLIFEKQKEWADSSDVDSLFLSYASELSLDIDKMLDDVDSSAVRNKVNNDVASGRKLGVNSTPTFYLGTEKMEGFSTATQLIDMIKAR